MWRPDGWEDIKTLSEVKYGGKEFCWSPSDYEAGADAMLEALREEGIPPKVFGDFLRYARYTTGVPLTNEVVKEGEIYFEGIKGKLVFIPDDTPPQPHDSP